MSAVGVISTLAVPAKNCDEGASLPARQSVLRNVRVILRQAVDKWIFIRVFVQRLRAMSANEVREERAVFQQIISLHIIKGLEDHGIPWFRRDDGVPGPAWHLVVARHVLQGGDVKYFLSNAQGASTATLLRRCADEILSKARLRSTTSSKVGPAPDPCLSSR